jgi:hypothetical protein
MALRFAGDIPRAAPIYAADTWTTLTNWFTVGRNSPGLSKMFAAKQAR